MSVCLCLQLTKEDMIQETFQHMSKNTKCILCENSVSPQKSTQKHKTGKQNSCNTIVSAEIKHCTIFPSIYYKIPVIFLSFPIQGQLGIDFRGPKIPLQTTQSKLCLCLFDKSVQKYSARTQATKAVLPLFVESWSFNSCFMFLLLLLL